MKLKILIAILIAAFSAQSVMAQHMTGCEIDTVLAKKLPMRAAMTRDITTSLPKAVSLQKFTPIPGDQGQTGTCTAWSSTYCIATMLWAMKNGITNRATITKNAFLPCYTYVNILTVSTTNCAVGTDIAQACAWLKNTGAVKLSLYPQNPSCISTNAIPSNWKSLAASNRIPNYTKLFLNYNNLLMKVTSTKQALAAGHPVLAAFKCPPSMSSSTGMLSDGTWNPSENPNVNYGGHALAVVAYDDALFGGSGGFLVQNSWGTSWGKSGYFWCSYYTYACWCYYAFEVHSQMSSSVSVDKSIANLNFGTSTNEYDYRDRNDYNNNYNNDNNNKYDNNKIDNNKNDNNKNDGKYVLVDEDWLKKIADQYGLNYNDFVKNNNNNNNNNN
ncbi:MAG: C1 family peptidase, partial [Bacteroidales bacterium]|nr:C1 family peptidase [Bacteroidales bacterium]